MVTRTAKTKGDLLSTAVALADQYQLVKHNSQLFAPVDWRNPELSAQLPAPDDRVWLPLSTEEVQEFGNNVGLILFQNPSEFSSFHYMLLQQAQRPSKPRADELFIKTDQGLMVLDPEGNLIEPHGEFIPNMLTPQLNPDPVLKQELLDIMLDWLVHPDVVTSLLHHLATMLAPGWSASKFVMLLGKGRNGKSTLLKMLVELLGEHNVSSITRQQMSSREPAIVDLNNKLANIVFDAPHEYLKDSSTEKTLVVGEKIGVRMLYANTNTPVWTNGLFIEGLNEEPMTRDKSNALQRRLVRFWFNKEYPLNLAFERKLLSEPYLGAFLSLLLDHYVKSDERADKLTASEASYDLQVEQLWANSKAFQWLYEVVQKQPNQATDLIGAELSNVVAAFHAWLLGNSKDDYSAVDAQKKLRDALVTEKKSKRINGAPRKVLVVTGFTPEAQRMIDNLTEEGEDDAADPHAGALVDD